MSYIIAMLNDRVLFSNEFADLAVPVSNVFTSKQMALKHSEP